MTKILFIHNQYQNIGGEDISVENEIKFLESKFNVKKVIFHNENRLSLSQLFSFFFSNNYKSNKTIQKIINEFQPDLAYVHNTWYTASLGLFKVLAKNNISTIVKLHNFRYDCTKTFFHRKHLKNNSQCGACGIAKSKYKIFNKYYEESYIKSILAINFGKKYFKHILGGNFSIFVLTKFHYEYLKKLGIEKSRISIYPNYLEIHEITKHSEKNNSLVYAGRISKDKGVEELITAFKSLNLEKNKLKIIGGGPEYKNLKDNYESDSIVFLGEKTNKEVLEIINTSSAVVTATKLFEGQPTVLCEASMLGVPSLFPDTGGISEFFPDNYEFKYKQYDYEDLKTKLIKLLQNSNMSDIGLKNKNYIEKKLDKNRLISQLSQKIYN
jgi:glycosyltransferase involved in cell wall biosynthesis|tara:strand:- start:651 stop:1799 length:1149 start_codon:yes stop_codon:yes gene_type:complete